MKIKSQSAFGWTAREGFIGALALILSSFALNQIVRIGFETSPGFADWMRAHSYLAECAFMFIRLCLWLIVAWICSRVPTFAGFLLSAGLNQRPTISGLLLALVVAVPTGLIDLALTQHGWIRPDQPASTYSNTNDTLWGFYIVYTVILSPVVEEILMRGFLYCALRGSFAIIPSCAVVVGVTIYFHWGMISDDLIALLSLVTGGTILCLIRERTASTWDCVLFHTTFNAVVMRQWPLCFIGLVAVLGWCHRYRDSKPRS